MQARTKSGFTLVELMISLAIAGTVSTAIYKLIRHQANTTGDQAKASQNLRGSQRIRTMISDDVSQSGFDPRYIDLSRSPINPFTSASNDSFTVQGDYNLTGTIGDQTASQDAERISYVFDASTNRLTRNGNPVLTNVQSFSVAYYDSSGASATSVPSATISALNKIKKVRIQWIQPTQDQGNLKEEVVVILRNYK